MVFVSKLFFLKAPFANKYLNVIVMLIDKYILSRCVRPLRARIFTNGATRLVQRVAARPHLPELLVLGRTGRVVIHQRSDLLHERVHILGHQH